VGRPDRSKYLIPFLVVMVAVLVILGTVVVYLSLQIQTPL
jgi:hypothetical protein